MFNWIIPFVAALVPLFVGFLWYHPKVFGTIWIKASGVTAGEKMKGAEMAKVFGLTYLFSLFAAVALIAITIHQTHVMSLFANDPASRDPHSEVGKMLADFMSKYGGNFRTFKHGAFHGLFMGILLVLPVIAVNALFERKGFKYIAVNTGFWMVSMALMGGVICAWF